MRNNTNDALKEKALKTGVLVTLTMMIPQLLFGSSKSVANTCSWASAGLMVWYLHDLGKRRRPGSNLMANANRFFNDNVDRNNIEADLTGVKNAGRNVINGGGAVFDAIVTQVGQLMDEHNSADQDQADHYRPRHTGQRR